MDKQEQLRLIKEILQHPGWEIYKNLIGVWRQEKNREQANILRQCSPETNRKANYIQGEIDGSVYTENILEEQKQWLSAENSENPAY